MEWVETTSKTVDEAKEMALDQLGVLEDDAEFEVLEEPKAGLFGRTRGNARVRARIAPSEPPPKQERRRRNGRNRSKDDQDKGQGNKRGSTTGNDSRQRGSENAGSRDKGDGRDGGRSGNNSGSRGERSRGGRAKNESGDREMMPEAEQREAGEEFISGLLAAMGYEGSVSSAMSDDGILSFDVTGESLGLLIGPGLNTLDAVQEVCRNAIQRQADGRGYGKVSVDVMGVRSERTAALQEFVRAEAQQVVDSGDDVVFEVMSRGDRKIVHDVVGEFDGLETESVGEDPRRRVVLKRS